MSVPRIPNKKEKKERMSRIVRALEQIYPESVCALEYGGEPWRLLVMARLSAQCTDARVNIVCRELFAEYPTVESLAAAPLSRIEEIVRPCGLFHTKAESIKASCQILVKQYGGRVPDTMEELLALPGVGRKIANLLLGDIYKQPAVVTDTHCIRICGRLGMYPTDLKDPKRVEMILVQLIEPEAQSDFCHRIVQFGRDVCMARSPRCNECPLRPLCTYGKT
jgi:endonuclease-3